MSNSEPLGRVPSISAIAHFLRAKGWEIEGQTQKYNLFKATVGDQEQELILARSENVQGWQKSAVKSVYLLSDLLEQLPEQIVSAILTIRADLIRSRIDDELVRNDSVDLETAVGFVNGLKSLMVSAAGAEISRSQLIGRASSQAIDFGRGCRFGHTFRGSFGFVIESPLPVIEPSPEPLFTDVASDTSERHEPFERRVVRRIARGMFQLNKATEEEDIRQLVESYPDGLNANMLDDLVLLHGAAQFGKVGFDFQWSPQISEKEISEGFSFVLDRRNAEIAEEASTELRKIDKPDTETVRGYVTDLHTDFDLRARDIFHDDRKIIVKLIDRGYYGRRLRIPLDDNDYKIAIEAHDSGALITVTGKMEKRGRFWHLIDPGGFTIARQR